MRIPTLAVTLAAAATVVALPTTANAVAPVAVNDTARAAFETAEVINVLTNDSNPDSGESLTVTSPAPTAAHGTVSCTAAGACTYTPTTGWRGTDTFTYTISDGGATPETATGTVTVETGIFAISVSSSPANLVAVDDPTDPTLRNPSHKVTGTVTGSGGVPVAGVQVQLYSRTSLTDDKVAVPNGLVTSSDTGRIVVNDLTPTQKTYYSWKSVAGKNSASERSVTVTPFLTTDFGDRRYAKGGTTTVTATSGPVTEGQEVVLQRKDATLGWVDVESKPFGAPAEDNSASVTFATLTHAVSGSYIYRVVVPQSDATGREQATSGQQTVSVYDAAITRIEAANSDEFVTVKNPGKVSINLNDWRLKDANSNIALPKRSIAPGGIVRIHTGRGTNDSNDLYLRRTEFLWANSGTVELWDNATPRVLMDQIVYP